MGVLMSTVFIENLVVGKFNLLLGYTKDYVVRLEFNTGLISEKNFLCFLNNNFERICKNSFKSDYTMIIEDYLNGKSSDLNIPVKLIGTDFNKRVWTELMKIPYGQLRTYGEIAKAVGSDKASRAVGNANNKNNIVLIVPCHRVIGSDKNLVGFAPGLNYKVELLKMEGHKIVSRGNNNLKKNLYYVEY